MRIKWLSLVRLMGLVWVLGYHFFQQQFPGGFIGVDILFTLSGFLITANWLDEYTKTEKIDLIRFGKKRLYRLLPALVLTILVVIPFTFLVKRDFVAGLGLQISSALGFVTNIYEMLIGGNYESQFVPHLFLHTWSLGVEVQFYLVWGILVWFLSKLRLPASRFRGAIFTLSAVLFLLSFVTMFVGAFRVTNVSMLYFSPLTRSFDFFVGSLFATVSGIRETTSRFKKNVRLWSTKQVLSVTTGAFLLLLLLGRILDFNHIVTYLFGFVLASLFSGVLIYCSRVLSDQTPSLSEPSFITGLADMSYGIYLFHWPFYIIFSQLMGNSMAVLLTMIFATMFAGLSYYLVEPTLAGKIPKIVGVELDLTPFRKWALGLVGVLTALMLGVVVTAPKVGAFETDLLVSSLHQADNKLNRTHTLLAGDARAISDVMIIGDSVTLRASSAIGDILPEAQVDAAVSRNFAGAYEIFDNHIQNGTLSQTVVIAVGVNSVYNYEADVDLFVENLPKGHRMILVTPYNVKDNRVPAVRKYEKALADKYKFITIADWYQAAQDHPAIWAGTDGVHFSESTQEGSEVYAKTIQKAIKKAAKHPAKGEKE